MPDADVDLVVDVDVVTMRPFLSSCRRCFALGIATRVLPAWFPTMWSADSCHLFTWY